MNLSLLPPCRQPNFMRSASSHSNICVGRVSQCPTLSNPYRCTREVWPDDFCWLLSASASHAADAEDFSEWTSPAIQLGGRCQSSDAILGECFTCAIQRCDFPISMEVRSDLVDGSNRHYFSQQQMERSVIHGESDSRNVQCTEAIDGALSNVYTERSK